MKFLPELMPHQSNADGATYVHALKATISSLELQTDATEEYVTYEESVS